MALITSCIFKQAHTAHGEESSIFGESRKKDGGVERSAAKEGRRERRQVIRSLLIDEDGASPRRWLLMPASSVIE